MDHDQSALLELEGEVLRPYVAAMVAALRASVGRGPRRRVLDLGAGTGSATFELAQRFADSEVIAVDAAEPHLERIRRKALDLGLAGRVRTVQADLDAEWPTLGEVDVAWASMSLHHLRDPDDALRRLHRALRPGGTLAVVEMGEPLWLFDGVDDLGGPGLADRAHEAFLAAHAEALPGLGQPWAPRIAAADFTVESDREVRVEVVAPYPPGLDEYAQHALHRVHAGSADRLSATDRDALHALAESGALATLLERDELVLRGSRLVTIARR